jgi:peptidoglycan/LPS O-acetylase OafA/YrhL
VALCGFIAAGTVGFSGMAGRVLEHPALQRIGEVSYGIYLYHNLAPMVAGKTLPFLWNGAFDTGAGALLRVAVFAAVTWGLTLASWRWIERPLNEMRSRMPSR